MGMPYSRWARWYDKFERIAATASLPFDHLDYVLGALQEKHRDLYPAKLFDAILDGLAAGDNLTIIMQEFWYLAKIARMIKELPEDQESLERIASDIMTPPEILAFLQHVAVTRALVAANPNTDKEILWRLCADYPREVFTNPAIPLILLEDPAFFDGLPIQDVRVYARMDTCPERIRQRWLTLNSADTHNLMLAYGPNNLNPRPATGHGEGTVYFGIMEQLILGMNHQAVLRVLREKVTYYAKNVELHGSAYSAAFLYGLHLALTNVSTIIQELTGEVLYTEVFSGDIAEVERQIREAAESAWPESDAIY